MFVNVRLAFFYWEQCSPLLKILGEQAENVGAHFKWTGNAVIHIFHFACNTDKWLGNKQTEITKCSFIL